MLDRLVIDSSDGVRQRDLTLPGRRQAPAFGDTNAGPSCRAFGTRGEPALSEQSVYAAALHAGDGTATGPAPCNAQCDSAHTRIARMFVKLSVQ